MNIFNEFRNMSIIQSVEPVPSTTGDGPGNTFCVHFVFGEDKVTVSLSQLQRAIEQKKIQDGDAIWYLSEGDVSLLKAADVAADVAACALQEVFYEVQREIHRLEMALRISAVRDSINASADFIPESLEL